MTKTKLPNVSPNVCLSWSWFKGWGRPITECLAFIRWRVRIFVYRWAVRLGIDIRLNEDDRRILEKIILPSFAADDGIRNVLFVGCDWYTKFYPRMFPGRKFWTLEIDPRKRVYGSKLHIVDSAVNIGNHFLSEPLDLIVCNGVLGYGLDSRDDVEKAFAGCFASLRTGGVLLVGWDDIRTQLAVPLDQCESLKFFRQHVFPPFGAWRTLIPNRFRKTYDFYIKE